MTKQDLLDKGALYFEHIQQAFSDCSYETYYMGEHQAVNYLTELWKKNGPENSYVDFYFSTLEPQSQKKVLEVLSLQEQEYMEEMTEGIFFPLDKMLLHIIAKLNDLEMLFSTVYFTKEPCTVWGNFKQEYVVFHKKQEPEETGKRPLQAVIFDMDGLMVDSERIVQRAWNVVGKEMGYGPLGDHIYNTLGMNLKRRREYFHTTFGEEFPFELFTEKYRSISNFIMQTEGVPIKEGLIELMEYLKKEGYPMLVATSSSKSSAEEKLAASGAVNYMEGMITGDQVTRSKPDPQIFELALEMLHAEPSKCIVLEDSNHGLQAALKAGAMPIMVPDLIKDLPEIEPELEAKLENLRVVKEYIVEHFYLEKRNS